MNTTLLIYPIERSCSSRKRKRAAPTPVRSSFKELARLALSEHVCGVLLCPDGDAGLPVIHPQYELNASLSVLGLSVMAFLAHLFLNA